MPDSEIAIGRKNEADVDLSVLKERRLTDPWFWERHGGTSDIWFSVNDRVVRPPTIPDRNATSGTAGWLRFDDILKESINYTGPGTVGTFLRGYSGFAWPETFQETTVADAAGLGIGAMLNTKTPTYKDWPKVVSGGYDVHIRNFFETWPVSVFGSFTFGHEPENDGAVEGDVEGSQRVSNPAYLAWARKWGPVWCRAVARIIKIAGPIIRRRGLDLKIGGCLMDFSWDSWVGGRFFFWDWWNYVDPADFDVTEFQLDIYGKSLATSPVSHEDLIPPFQNALQYAKQAGIFHWSIFETATSRTEKFGGGTEVGTYQSQADWYYDYAARLKQIPGGRLVGHFSVQFGDDPSTISPLGSDVHGPGIKALADMCMNGRRP